MINGSEVRSINKKNRSKRIRSLRLDIMEMKWKWISSDQNLDIRERNQKLDQKWSKRLIWMQD